MHGTQMIHMGGTKGATRYSTNRGTKIVDMCCGFTRDIFKPSHCQLETDSEVTMIIKGINDFDYSVCETIR